jgi:hypothetical protein
MNRPLSLLRRLGVLTATVAVGLAAVPTVASAAPKRAEPGGSAALMPYQLVADRDVGDRLPFPEDRYALAGGCYAIEAPGAGFVTRDGGALTLTADADAAAAEPFHFQATRLGQYLIVTNEGPDTTHEGAWWDERGYLSAASGVLPVPGVPGLSGGGVTVADAPSDSGDWQIVAAGDDPDRKVTGKKAGPQDYLMALPGGGALAVDGGALTLADTGSPFRFHHVPDDDPTDDDPNGTACATWPEIDTNVDGRPKGNKRGPAGKVEGFFEAHIHGMAFEFLGGELRCGRPWHPYGVEYALPNCQDGMNQFNSVLEVAVAGQDPSDPFTSYDPVGWPTFDYWPQYDTLTHEQFYWRWLERAHLGGLRLLTNLLVDNTALCQVFPVKKNSCNEMDGVRLQAQRLFELQDYIDAQRGGPGEGWLRIVTTPAQAREVINAGRLAVVLGIEVSVLFDCGEILDVPQCTEDEIDERLQEVYDMGVRQMELINKFDNALSGVTGDGGTTGLVVNGGNKLVTGHFWDMQTCPDEHSHEHGNEYDKRQMNFADDSPSPDEIDVLAGTVLSLFAPTKGFVAPLYPAGPHCNTRGLTELGEHLITGMIEKGMIFDPDHMSASAQRRALDLIQHELIPAEHAAAEAEKRAPIQPAVISSHSWANDVIYQRIYQVDGVVAPRTAAADRFADDWAQHRAWFAANAPKKAPFGLGYGADTNGFGGQPGPRRDPAQPVDYAAGFRAPIGGDVVIHQQTSGLKTYDINTDGVAHYGLFADWFHEVALAAAERQPELGGAEAITKDMLAGAETYLRLWERAVYGTNECVEDHSTFQVEDLHALLGLNVEGFLRAVGQPIDRDDAVYTYCVAGADGEVQAVDVHFDEEGRAAELAENPGTVTPAPAGSPAAAAGHGHGAPAGAVAAAGGALPATGGGMASTALLLLGLAGVGARGLTSRRAARGEN